MDESGTGSGGVVTPVPNFGSGCLLVAVALGLGLVALGVRFPWPVVCSPSPVSFLWGPSLGKARNWPVMRPKRKGTDLKNRQ